MADLVRELGQLKFGEGIANALSKIGEEIGRSQRVKDAEDMTRDIFSSIDINKPESFLQQDVAGKLFRLQSMPGSEGKAAASSLGNLFELAQKAQQTKLSGIRGSSPGTELVDVNTGSVIHTTPESKDKQWTPIYADAKSQLTPSQLQEYGIKPSVVETPSLDGRTSRSVVYPEIAIYPVGHPKEGKFVPDWLGRPIVKGIPQQKVTTPGSGSSGGSGSGKPLNKEQHDALVDLIGTNRGLPRMIFTVRNQELPSLMADVALKYPGYDMTAFTRRLDTAKDFSSKGKSGQNVVRMNQGIGHLGSMYESGKALENASLQLWNTIANKGLEYTGDPRVDRFLVDAEAVAGELASIFKGTSGTDQEIKAWRERLHASKSPEQIKAIIHEAVELLGSRVNAMRDIYTKQFGQVPERLLLSEKSVEVFRKLGIDPEEVESGKVGTQYYNPTQLRMEDSSGLKSKSDDELMNILMGK